MAARRPRSPSLSPSAPSPTKLCLICGGLSPKTGNQEYHGFFLDPTEAVCDADEFVPKKANFRLDGFDLLTFYVWNFTLYMFESDDFSQSGEKSVYALDLSAVNSSQMAVFEKGNLQKGSLQKMPDMLCIKHIPSAVSAPGGKILVFSNNIYAEPGYDDMIDFEVYDPMTKLWSKLPQLCRPSEDDYIRVYGSGFLNESLFFVATTNGNYAFDFNEQCWREHTEFKFVQDFLLVGNEFYLSLGSIRRSGDGRVLTGSPLLSFFPDSVYDRDDDEYGRSILYSSAVSLLDFVPDKEFSFCVAQVVLDVREQPFVIFDIFDTDLAKYRQGDCAQLCSNKVQSFKFIPSMKKVSCHAYGFFPVPMREGTDQIDGPLY
ncbi:hypothetical protein C2S52_023006 [Perilla frutescens var. hirtella]|nr:hypothetical protein C2S52_023006 [Perilla frutescens var. hirtella]